MIISQTLAACRTVLDGQPTADNIAPRIEAATAALIGDARAKTLGEKIARLEAAGRVYGLEDAIVAVIS